MGNLVCGAAGKNFFAARVHDLQGKLSRVSEAITKVAAMASSGGILSNMMQQKQKQLELKKQKLETMIQLTESLLKAHEELLASASKDAAPQLNVGGGGSLNLKA